MLSEQEKRIIAEIQGDIPITERPFRQIAERLEIEEDVLLSTLRNLCRRGVIRRFGATLRHQKSGYTANAMTAWQVDADRLDAVGRQLSALRQVSHCYQRKALPQWPYTIYAMIHGRDKASCRAIAQKMAEKMGITSYTILFSQEELKKTSMAYFQHSRDD